MFQGTPVPIGGPWTETRTNEEQKQYEVVETARCVNGSIDPHRVHIPPLWPSRSREGYGHMGQMITEAKTPVEHEALAAFYEQEAQAAREASGAPTDE